MQPIDLPLTLNGHPDAARPLGDAESFGIYVQWIGQAVQLDAMIQDWPKGGEDDD